MFWNIRYSVYVFVVAAVMHGFCLGTQYDHYALTNELTAIGTKDMRTSCITFARSSSGQKYVIKQCKIEPHFFRPVKTVLEMVALEIGYQMHIPLNESWVIPVGVPCIGKELNVPASLHLFLPGMPFDEWDITHPYNNPYHNLKIKQKDPLGLSLSVIQFMWKHKDLPRMVAYDTFVGNADRGMANLFYDKAHDAFYGIDMGSAFSTNLCESTVMRMQEYLATKHMKLTQNEWNGLFIYYTTLKELIALYPPETVCSMIDAMIDVVGLGSACTVLAPEVIRNCHNYVGRCKRTFQKSYNDAQELCHVLQSFLKEKRKIT